MIYDILLRTWVDTIQRLDRIWNNIRRMREEIEEMKNPNFSIPVDSSSDEEQPTSTFKKRIRKPCQHHYLQNQRMAVELFKMQEELSDKNEFDFQQKSKFIIFAGSAVNLIVPLPADVIEESKTFYHQQHCQFLLSDFAKSTKTPSAAKIHVLVNNSHKFNAIADTGSSFNSISESFLRFLSSTIHPSSINLSKTHSYNTSNGQLQTKGETFLKVVSDFFPPMIMRFSITARGPFVIGRPQILKFTDSQLAQIVRNQSSHYHMQYTQLQSHSYIYQFIINHLYSTVPFHTTSYTFSLGTLTSVKPPQIHSSLSFSRDLLALKQHIDEHLRLQIIEVGQLENWLHQFLPVPHYDKNKIKDGIR